MTKLPLAKQLKLAAIVGGVAFVTSMLLAMVTAGVPADQRTTPTGFIGLIFGVVAGVAYLLLSNNRTMPIADDASRVRALAGPENGSAQLLVVRQGRVGRLAGVDVLVDGAVVTQLKSPRFAAIPVPPGRHRLTATVQGKTTPPEDVDLAAGETAVVRVDMAIGRARLVREPDVEDMRRVLASVPMVAST